LIEQQGVAFAVIAIQMDYVKPAKFNDELIISTHIHQLKRVSMVFHQTIICPANDNELINKAEIKVACLDAKTMAIKAIPTTMIETLT